MKGWTGIGHREASYHRRWWRRFYHRTVYVRPDDNIAHVASTLTRYFATPVGVWRFERRAS